MISLLWNGEKKKLLSEDIYPSHSVHWIPGYEVQKKVPFYEWRGGGGQISSQPDSRECTLEILRLHLDVFPHSHGLELSGNSPRDGGDTVVDRRAIEVGDGHPVAGLVHYNTVEDTGEQGIRHDVEHVTHIDHQRPFPGHNADPPCPLLQDFEPVCAADLVEDCEEERVRVRGKAHCLCRVRAGWIVVELQGRAQAWSTPTVSCGPRPLDVLPHPRYVERF